MQNAGAFCNAFDLHKAIIGLENCVILVFFLSGRLRQVLLYANTFYQVSVSGPLGPCYPLGVGGGQHDQAFNDTPLRKAGCQCTCTA